DENKPIRCSDCGGPQFDDLILIWRPAERSRRDGLIEERHRKVAKIEQPRVDSGALLEMLKNPLCRLFRKPALTRAADDYGNSDHVVFLLLIDVHDFRRYATIPVRTNSTSEAAGTAPAN